MFTADNFYSNGIDFDYDMLNKLLSDAVTVDPSAPTYEDERKNVGAVMANSMYIRGMHVWIGDVIVGDVWAGDSGETK